MLLVEVYYIVLFSLATDKHMAFYIILDYSVYFLLLQLTYAPCSDEPSYGAGKRV